VSYLAVCTFDLKNATAEDYQKAYDELRRIGFSTSVMGDNGSQIVLPTTTTAGAFDASDASTLRDKLIDQVGRAFTARGLKAEIFITVGTDWRWAHQKAA
jgi:hypothetical protein